VRIKPANDQLIGGWTLAATTEDPRGGDDRAGHRRLQATSGGLPAEAPSGTRGRILSAALHLFSEQGFHGTSIRDIARDADVQSASLYAFYESKAHILRDLITFAYEHHAALLRSVLLETSSDPAAQLAALVRAHVKDHAEHAMLGVVAASELHALPPSLAAPLVVLRDQIAQVVLDVVERGIKVGAFNPPEPYWLTVAAIGAMGMRVAHWFHPGSSVTADEVAEVYATLACRMVGAPDPAPSQRSDERKVSR
jgi:AcrR family transcriptional regulator